MVKTVFKYIKKYKLYLVIMILFRIISWVVELVQPYIISKYIDKLRTINITELLYFIKILAILFIIRIVVTYFNSIIVTKFNMKAYFDLAYDVIEHVKKVPLLYFNNVNAAYLNEKINSDSNEVISFMTSNIISFIIIRWIRNHTRKFIFRKFSSY